MILSHTDGSAHLPLLLLIVSQEKNIPLFSQQTENVQLDMFHCQPGQGWTGAATLTKVFNF